MICCASGSPSFGGSEGEVTDGVCRCICLGLWHTHGLTALENLTKQYPFLKQGWRPIQRGTPRNPASSYGFLKQISYSFLLTFAYVEAQEAKKEFADVHATFDRFLAALRTNLEALEHTASQANNGQPNSQSTNGTANGNASIVVPPLGSITETGIHSNNSSFNTQSSDGDKPPKGSELAEKRTEYGLAWIVYMRFGRRAEGVKSSRAIFGKARKDRWAPWEVYEAAGMFNSFPSILLMDDCANIYIGCMI